LKYHKKIKAAISCMLRARRGHCWSLMKDVPASADQRTERLLQVLIEEMHRGLQMATKEQEPPRGITRGVPETQIHTVATKTATDHAAGTRGEVMKDLAECKNSRELDELGHIPPPGRVCCVLPLTFSFASESATEMSRE
jgi:hypothetical protein